MNTNRLGVIGVGKLGLSFALLAEHSGYGVIGCDTRQDYVNSLFDKKYQTIEPYVTQYLHKSKSFMPTTDLEATVQYADILFVLVATPSLADGSYDHSHIDSIVQQLQELHVRCVDMSNKILVIGCTTMPGYSDTVASRLEATGISVVYNPEFIAQGSIIDGLRYADMVLMGVQEERTYQKLAQVYRKIMGKTPNIRRMSLKAAEITKIAINCFLTTKIAYANMIGEIAINSGLEYEVNTILKAIGDDSRIGHKFLGYGFGFSGPCLPRDNRALGIHATSVGINTILPITVDDSNNEHAEFLLKFFTAKNPNKSVPFLFTQLAYKKGTDMLVESQQYRLCKDLLAAGYSVDIVESPVVVDIVKKELVQYADRITFGTITSGFKIEL